jgi:hypothetical protein
MDQAGPLRVAAGTADTGAVQARCQHHGLTTRKTIAQRKAVNAPLGRSRKVLLEMH